MTFPSPFPRRLIPRRVLVELSCGHAVTLDLPPEIDPGPGYTLHCYECGHAVQVVSLTSPGSPASVSRPGDTPQADLAAQTPILHHVPRTAGPSGPSGGHGDTP